MFVVTYQRAPGDPVYYLRGTVWTFSKDRATQHPTQDEANEAIKASAKFNPKAAKVASIRPYDQT